MKIIHATWEKRNLGRDAWEYVFEPKDDKDILENMALLNTPDYDGAYLCAKVSAKNVNIIHALEDFGFRFMETQIGMSYDFTVQRLPSTLKRYDGYLSCEEVKGDKSLWNEVTERVTDEMFITDRIYLDSMFPPGTSSLRYRNWMNDMKSNPDYTMLVWRIVKTGEIIGFDIMRSLVPTAVAILGGVFPGKVVIGLIHTYCFLKYLSNKGAQNYKTNISSNNTPMLRCYSELGVVANNITYVLRKIG